MSQSTISLMSSSQMGELRTSTSQPLGLVLQFSFRAIASLGLALYTSWKLSLVTLAGIPVFSSMIAFLSTRIKLNIQAQETELSNVSKIAHNATTSIDTVKCLNGQEFEYRNFVSRVDKAAVHYLKQARFNSLQITLLRVMMLGMFVQGFWYGSSMAISGELSAGDVLRTIWASLLAAQSIELALPQVIVLEKGKIAAATLENVISNQSGNKTANEMKGNLYPRHCEGDIEVNNVCTTGPRRPAELTLTISDVLLLLIAAGHARFEVVKLFLPCGQDHFCYWKKWIRQKHPWPIAHTVILASLWRNSHRWRPNTRIECQLDQKQHLSY